MEANSKAPVHNFKIHGYRNNISFILGSPFRRGWGDSFGISESERWYQQAWCALHPETRQQVIRREKLQFPPCECVALCVLRLESPRRLFAQHSQVTQTSFNFYKRSEKWSGMKTWPTVFPSVDAISLSHLHSEKTNLGCFPKEIKSESRHSLPSTISICLFMKMLVKE